MFKKFIFLLILGLGVGGSVFSTDWDAAEKVVTRLSPDAFPQLPLNIRKNLRLRGCNIPQCFETRQPHNVIKGSFLKKGRTDWAVLCSTGGISSILIYSSGSVKNVVVREALPDKNFLQGMGGENKLVYSRIIGVVPAKDILRIAGESKYRLSPEAHDGIVDAFAEKGSLVLYYDNDKWIDLPGSD